MIIFKNLRNIFLLIVFVCFASLNCAAQTMMQGNVYDFGSKDCIIGANIFVTKKTETDSATIICGKVSRLEGKFEIENLPKGIYDLKFEYLYCYPTIIKDILIDRDTIYLFDIPLFKRKTMIYEDGFIIKKRLWGIV